MTGIPPSHIWQEQCDATVTIRTRFGCHAAFEYLVLEKLETFSGIAAQDAAFARELPSFIAAIRQIFAATELQSEFARYELDLKQMDDDILIDEMDVTLDDIFEEPAAVTAARSERFALLKQLLLSPQLGIA